MYMLMLLLIAPLLQTLLPLPMMDAVYATAHFSKDVKHDLWTDDDETGNTACTATDKLDASTKTSCRSNEEGRQQPQAA